MAVRKKVAKKAAKPVRRDPKVLILAALHKKFGKASATTVADELAAIGQIKEYIPTGVDVIDNHLCGGRGGLPVGRWSEWFGDEGTGKTALAYTALASCQRAGGVAVLIDAEHTFDFSRSALFGIDNESLIILEPLFLEEALNEIRTTLEAHDASCPMLIVWDTIAALAPEKETETDAGGKKQPGSVASLMSSEMKKINSILPKKRCHIMMLNQVRVKFGVLFGPNVETPGGKAVKFYASLRGHLMGGKAVKVGKQKKHIAKVITLLMVKSRLSEPFRKARIRFDYADGYNNMWSTIEHAKNEDLIDPREDGYKGKGREGIDAYIDALSTLGWKPSQPIPKPALSDAGTGEEIDDGSDDEDDD